MRLPLMWIWLYSGVSTGPGLVFWFVVLRAFSVVCFWHPVDIRVWEELRMGLLHWLGDYIRERPAHFTR
jgi:hypothetical protein